MNSFFKMQDITRSFSSRYIIIFGRGLREMLLGLSQALAPQQGPPFVLGALESGQLGTQSRRLACGIPHLLLVPIGTQDLGHIMF